MDMKRFADFWRGMFYLTGTITLGILIYLLVVVWQPLWAGGFNDFGTISQAIRHLDETAKPAADMAPLMLTQMNEMNQNMRNMNMSVVQLNENMSHMRLIMGHQMTNMNYQIDRMNNKFSPMGMMPFNWR